MIPGWFRDAIPRLIALCIAGALWVLNLHEWAAGFLAVCIVVVFIYHQWMLAHLSSWASLPTRRDLAVRGLSSAAWSQVFDKLTRSFKALREENQELRADLSSVHAAVDKVEDALILLDRYNLVAWSNQSAQNLFGFVGAAGLQRPMHHFLRDPRFSEMLDKQFHSKSKLDQRLRLGLPQQAGLIFEIHLIQSDDDKKLLIVRDVTEQAKLDAVKSDFIANISHEIRTPLTVVSGYTETLLDLDLSKDEQHKHLETILKQSQTMQNLVADLLALSSLEQELDSRVETGIDLQRLFNEIEVEARAISAGQHKISFHVDHPVLLRGVAEEIGSAVRNLVSNAIRYTPTGGKIDVSFRFMDKFGRLCVQDAGVGIAAEHIPRLTERFYRVDRGRSRGAGGTGLGLAIVKRIANRHQMELEISSNLGEGSQFCLKIPTERLIFTPSEAARHLTPA